MINPQKPVINPIKIFNRFTALLYIYVFIFYTYPFYTYYIYILLIYYIIFIYIYYMYMCMLYSCSGNVKRNAKALHSHSLVCPSWAGCTEVQPAAPQNAWAIASKRMISFPFKIK